MTTRVPIRYGGTGANTAADARTALGVSSSDTTNTVYNAANSAANTVRVSQNGASTLSAKQLNFVNTTNVTIAVTDSGDGNANITFEVAAGGGGGGTLSNIAISSNGVFTTNANAFNFINTATVSVTVESGVDGNANISFTSAGGGGSNGTVIVRDNFTGDGNTVNFTLTTEPEDQDHTLVFVDLVFQSETAYSVSGTTLTFGTAPDNGANVDVYIYGSGVGSTVVTSDVFTGDGACTSYSLTQTATTSRAFVYLDGVAQRPQYDYQVSGTTLSFNVAPANATIVEVRTLSAFNTVDINVAPVTLYSDKFTGTGSCTEFTMSQSGTTDSTFVFLNGVSQKPGTDFTVGGVSNATLTLTSAPANGSILEVRSMGAFKISENQSRIDSDIFNGDGNTVSFTLSTNSTTKKTFVFIDGVAQKPINDYSVAGTTLTFTEAPPDGTFIEVRSVAPFIFATSTSDLAYDQANTAYSQANAAYSQANAAYSAANNAASNAVLKAGDTMTGQLNISAGGLLVTGNVNFDAGTLFLDSVNDRLGLGISSPNTLLHIAGTTTLQEVLEKVNVSATAMGANLTVDVLDGAVTLLTANSTANSTLNIRGNSTVLLDTVMTTGQSLTTVVMVTNGSSGYKIANLQIDGTSVTPKWSGNNVPTANSNAIDIYAFTAIKTAANVYTVLGSKTEFV